MSKPRIPTPERREEIKSLLRAALAVAPVESFEVTLGIVQAEILGLLAALEIVEAQLAELRERVTRVAKSMRSRDEFEPGPITNTSFIEIWVAQLLDICGETEDKS